MNAYCINLPDRPERWRQTVEEFKKTQFFDLIRFEGRRMRPGWAGCTYSHLTLLSQIKDEVFMICEDDVVFKDDVDKWIPIVFSQLPDDWDMLYLGATLNEELKKYSDNLYILKKGYTTHAIIYNNKRIIDYILSKENIRKIDVFYWEVQEKFNCFITCPMLATQRPGNSDIIKKYTDYSAINENYKKYIK